jgi:hypothetical protein
MTVKTRPDRKFALRQEIIYRVNDKVLTGRVSGYEWSDGTNHSGKPPCRYNGWFYHIEIPASLSNTGRLVVPESRLTRV